MKLLRLWQSVTIAVVVVAFLAVPAFAVPVYEAIPGGAVSGTTGPIYDATPVPDYSGDGADWGTAEVKYWYWQDAEDWWHYNYQIINNIVTYSGGYGSGSESDPPQGHHFGWFYNTSMGGNSDQYVGIYIFSMVGFGALSPTGDGPSDLEVLGWGGSSAGGDAWDDFLDPNNTGLDWENKTGLQVDSTRWLWDGGGNPNDDEWIVIPGETSTDDSNGQYFQIASKWGPGICTAEIVINGSTADETHVQLLAYDGDVMGPVVIPEPATCLLFALGGLALVSKRRRTR